MAGLRECWLGIADLGGCLMGLFLAGSGVLCGLIWLEGIRRNLGIIEGLELIFRGRVDGGVFTS